MDVAEPALRLSFCVDLSLTYDEQGLYNPQRLRPTQHHVPLNIRIKRITTKNKICKISSTLDI